MLMQSNKGISKFLVYFLPFLILALALFNFRGVFGETLLTKFTKSNPIKIVFTGDINFDRYVRRQALKKGNYNYIFDQVRDIFNSADLVVSNLEGSITKYNSISMGTEIGSKNNYIFTFPPETAPVLYNENIRLVNLGNNHIFNFGSKGVQQTKVFLGENKVNYFGHLAVNQSFADETYVGDFAGFRILFVNYNQFIKTDLDKLLVSIKAEKENVDFVILYAHWGSEYQPVANQTIQALAHKFIDAGVDLIIGSHPHVVQQSEIYQGKKIYYSLGNFIFDQYFSDATREGLVVGVEINPDNKETIFKEYKTHIEFDSGVTLIE